jgi:hypothetical protein
LTMKALHTLAPFIILPSLFVTEIGQLQATESFSFDRATWYTPREILALRGTGTPGAIVDTFIAGTDIYLGSEAVNSRGYWGLKLNKLEFAPCGVRAKSGTFVMEQAVSQAPADCIGADETPPPNTPPVISGSPGTQVAEGQTYRFVPSASDADGDSLTFSIANRPSWASFNTSTGALSGTPGYNSAGTTSNIRISVSDGNATASLNAFSITVSDTNRAPSISGSPVTNIDEGEAYTFAPVSSDPDGDTLTYSISGLPSWASFNNSTGTLSGTPDSNSAGTYGNIVISVSDGSNTASLAGFAITVNDVAQGGTFKFTQNAYSVDEGSVLTLTISRDNTQGEASVSCGTDGIDARSTQDYIGFHPVSVVFQAGESSKTITVTTLADDVTDPDETLYVYLWTPSEGYSLATPNKVVVTINELANANNAPSINGTPATSATVGQEYRFVPTATDEDNDPLTFSVTNLPAWASFNTSTGELSGTPGSGDAGDYASIVISVTDGTDSASLSPMSITVATAEPTVGSVSLAWTPPSTRTDGSTLDMSEIGGYRIYMGTTTNNLQQVLDLADSTITDYMVDNLDNGDYYFAVTTYDTDGNESEFSNIALKSTM